MNNTTHNYMAGHCHVMAIALKTLHPEWQMRANVGWDAEAEDDDDYRVDHVYLVAPDGAAYDSRGCFVSEEALVSDGLTEGVETQCVNFDLADIQRLVQRGELKPFTRQDVDTTINGVIAEIDTILKDFK
jgi:hypothetical protein